MATNLNNIITAISECATNIGFVKVEQYRINLNSNADTELPKLFIKLNKINYSNFLKDTAEENYNIDLIIIIADSANPISDLKDKIDQLLKEFTNNILLNKMLEGQKINILETDLTNNRDYYSKLGGEGAALKILIKNVNNFGNMSCY